MPRLPLRACVRSATAGISAVLIAACDGGRDRAASGFTPPPTPAELAHGDSLFHAHCASCHGAQALGTTVGPPLVHRVYEPSHHSDASFVLAVTSGVRAHHWRFGDMPPQPHVTREEIEQITAYVRWLQREAGIH